MKDLGSSKRFPAKFGDGDFTVNFSHHACVRAEERGVGLEDVARRILAASPKHWAPSLEKRRRTMGVRFSSSRRRRVAAAVRFKGSDGVLVIASACNSRCWTVVTILPRGGGCS